MPKRKGSRIADYIIKDYKKEKRLIAEGERRKAYGKKDDMYNNGRKNLEESKTISNRRK